MQLLQCSVHLTREPCAYPPKVFRRELKQAVLSVQDRIDERSSKLRIVRRSPRAQVTFQPSSSHLVALFPVRYKEPLSYFFFRNLFDVLKTELEDVRGVARADLESSYLIPLWQK